jgi:hypothetical protein
MPKPVAVLYVHHDAGQFMSDPVPTIQGIQRLHQDVHHWSDIAYQEWIAYTGDAFEGRGFGVVDGATGCQGGESLSICMQGNFENVIPARAQIDTLVARIVAAAQEGRLSKGFQILAHNQAPPCKTSTTSNTNATQCCGKHLISELPEIRRRVALALSPPPANDIPTPSPTPTPEDDMAPFYVHYKLHPQNASGVGEWLVDWTGDKSPVHDGALVTALAKSQLIAKVVDLSASKPASDTFLNAMHK